MTHMDHGELEILLVEDSFIDALMTREALTACSSANPLHVVENGEEAMAFLRREGQYADRRRPGLILLDLNLPRKSGHEVLAEVKSDESLKTIPVIVLTTSKAEDDLIKSYSLRANCYITKPMDLSRLTEVVRQIHEFWFHTATMPLVERN